MQRVVSAAIIFTTLGLSGLAAAELPPPRASFSADAVVEVGGERIVHKVYHSAGQERQEMEVDGLVQVTILRPDLDSAFVIQPGLEDYLELPIEEAALLPGPELLPEHETEMVGEGREGGEPVTKYRLFTPEGEVTGFELVISVTEDGIVMRAEGAMTFEGEKESVLLIRRDVKRGPQDPALFDPELAQQAMEEEYGIDVPDSHKNIGRTGP